MLTAPASAITTVTFSNGIGGPTGGVFDATLSTGDTFPSFCLELPEKIDFSSTFGATFADRAYRGGGGSSPDPTAPTPGPQTSDPLSIGSAYLYSAFRDGSLQFDVTTAFDASNANHINALQQAFWLLEDEGVVYDAASVAGADQLIDRAKFVTGLSDVTVDAGPNNAYGVQVMNVWGLANGEIDYSMPRQSQTYLPDGGTTAVLFGLGLIGIAAVRRRMSRSVR